MAGPMDFWRLVREVNPNGIHQDADRAFRVAALGSEPELAELRRLAGFDVAENRARAGDRWLEAALPLSDSDRPRVAACTFALTLSRNAENIPITVWRLDPQAMEPAISAILDKYPDLNIALPRAVPAFRSIATDRIIAAAARANTQLALASALPGVVPWTAVLLPAAAFPDMVLLTKNQGMMCLRIAAAYGFPVEPQRRLAELGGVIGVAFGWRALARELVGLVPGGVGAGLKGAIAYAATVTTGRAAQALYSGGALPTVKERTEIFREAFRRRRAEPEASPA
ncbi:MAG TPA: hypothetical protein VGM37_13350 [Armatimonadota bacterium]|jgi:uncharacterized protein (DUF697 family)